LQHHDVGTLVRQGDGNRLANALLRTGYQRCLICQIRHARLLLVSQRSMTNPRRRHQGALW
jgi:hypothetical protein